jgi:preprotein translocase subunit SecG
MKTIHIAQIAVSIILAALVLFQQRGSGLGSAFGQEGGVYATRRGVQKKVFYATIVFGVLFIALALANLLL